MATTVLEQEKISEQVTPQWAGDRSNTGSLSRQHSMPFGAEVRPDGHVRFRLFAPAADRISVAIEGRSEPLPMTSFNDGWHELLTGQAGPGTLYRFVLPDGMQVPDPGSRFQPQDVAGPSEVIAPGSFLWKDGSWTGRPWKEAVIYEFHVGTFTPEGTFTAAIGKLDHLVSLGVTAIELMPIADFPGLRGWGYDGVLLYAPDSSYGRPEDLKELVQAAHARGLMVMLDVVYNHFGPEGNYLPSYFPNLLTDRHKTSWGSAVNYDGEQSEIVRELVIHNAMYWIEEFHLDGLRLDAVHAIMDSGPKHLLDELADRVHALDTSYPVHLVLENEKNEAARLTRNAEGRPEHFTAQWNDDVHHVLHTAATHEDAGYYKDYKGHTELLGRALAEGFAFQGEPMTCSGEKRGESCGHLPPNAFIAFIQNHDQIGNRAFGERIDAITNVEALKSLVATYLLLPQTPMIFMGEEWRSTQPFPYFCDFHGELGEKVREGRRNEFASFPEFQDPAKRDEIPDPLAESTFMSAKLDWNELNRPEHTECLERHRNLLAVRRREIVPIVDSITGDAASFRILGPGAVVISWGMENGQELRLHANLSDQDVHSFPQTEGRILWHEGPEPEGTLYHPWTVRWALKDGKEA
ncbi:MAG: malto-oligosyltrehalose trehalohydrolase [Janthinobacterium lividum]